jgi:hypothetical protein
MNPERKEFLNLLRDRLFLPKKLGVNFRTAPHFPIPSCG